MNPTNVNGDLAPLVATAARGDREAYGELVSRTSGLVSSVALAIVRDIDLSRDVAQDVFLALWRDLKSLRNPASFLPWLRQTARNRAHAALRSRIRGRRLGETGGFEAALAQIADPQPDASERLARDEEARALAEALDALPDETREIVILFYREGESIARVASLFELSETVVKKRLSRARERLRGDVRERLGETVKRCGPDRNFTAAVMAALPAASAPVSAGGGMVAAKAGGLAVLKAVLPALASGLGGAVSVVLIVRPLLRTAIDEQERRGLMRYAWVGIGVVLLWSAALLPVISLSQGSLPPMVAWLASFFAILAALAHLWLPRILRRRFEAEMRADPAAAARRRRRERQMAAFGWTFGIAMGSMGMAIGFWFSK